MTRKWFGDQLRTDMKKGHHGTFKITADLEYMLNVQMSVGITIIGDCILTNKAPGLDHIPKLLAVNDTDQPRNRHRALTEQRITNFILVREALSNNRDPEQFKFRTEHSLSEEAIFVF